MFPSTTIESPARRSFRELMRGALGTAIEFATLGEATIAGATSKEEQTVPPTPQSNHPHRRALSRPSRPRRPGAVPPRHPVCTAPVPSSRTQHQQ